MEFVPEALLFFNVFSNKRRVVKNDLITIFPYQLASITEISTDFAVIFFKVPKKLFMDTINGLGRLTLDYFFLYEEIL